MTSFALPLTQKELCPGLWCGLTGITGFVGGALAAKLLHQGVTLVALVRELNQSRIAQNNVRRSAKGLGIQLPDDWEDRLFFDELKPKGTQFSQCEVVIHSAADMSYDLSHLEESIGFNSGYSTWLLNRSSRSEKRPLFIYVSTAYVAPHEHGPILEKFHNKVGTNNSYQLSKSIAESALVSFAENHDHDLVIFRPSIIVGSSKTGFSPKRSNGFYKFVDAFELAKKFGKGTLHFSLNPEAVPNFVSIDSVVSALEKIVMKFKFIRGVKFFHCAGQSNLNNAQLTSIVARWFEMVYSNTRPTTSLERRIEKNLISLNAPFSNATWLFCLNRINYFIGTDWQSPIRPEAIKKMIGEYLIEKKTIEQQY